MRNEGFEPQSPFTHTHILAPCIAAQICVVHCCPVLQLAKEFTNFQFRKRVKQQWVMGYAQCLNQKLSRVRNIELFIQPTIVASHYFRITMQNDFCLP